MRPRTRIFVAFSVILLLMDTSTMWPDRIEEHYGGRDLGCGCYLEATSRPEFEDILPDLQLDGVAAGHQLTQLGDRILSVTWFPLRDFRGEQDPSLPDVGTGFVWEDATQAHQALRRDRTGGILLALFSYLVVELFLFMGLGVVLRVLEGAVEDRTREVHRLLEEAEASARTDVLTGLANRHHLNERLAQQRARSLRYQEVFSVILLDIDHFKRVNDTRGHLAGDSVLSSLGRLLRSQVREVDLPARYGGEEFCVLLPEADLAGAATLAERIRHAVEQNKIVFQGVGLSVTVSLGVAQWRGEETVEALLARADARLYRAKELGRNRVVLDDR